MQSLIVDKISSVAIANDIGREIRISPDIPCEEGVIVAAKVLNNKSRYNTLELTSGRMAQIKKGDIIIGALGHRKALFGYSGHIPEKLSAGDKIQVLNLGGVLGICDSINISQGSPFDCEVLGVVLEFPFLGERIGVPAKVGAPKKNIVKKLDLNQIPIIAIAGTCMDSGKTVAACSIISQLNHNGFTVDAFKSTGVALRRDILAMEDAGARNTEIFSDYGVVATTSENSADITKKICSSLANNNPDVIVCEFGDGILGAYGVESILLDKELKGYFSSIVLCANDPIGAWGGVKILKDNFNLTPSVVTGPATDNQVGIDIIEKQSSIKAINALTNSTDLGNFIESEILPNNIGSKK
ncbi:MAG: hypothetical protein CBC38_02240 [Gammaproteobacteria bacterium TMED78]|nr:MAG: hypothetical protein CBC38_02240 [Gammaproteobacteria bacterium TMED78]|tara:strand:- start:182379 stop:183446 length:1068 start_codon:yes stop_codon:yes gene_type:complete